MSTFNNDETINDLPILTEVVEEPIFGAARLAEQDEEEIALLFPQTPQDANQPCPDKIEAQLERLIETLLKQKLLVQFEEMQFQAITQAVNEIKMELPELIRKAIAGKKN